MDTHERDPTVEDREGDPWGTVSSEFGQLKDRIAGAYRRVADENGPSEEEIKQAFVTLAGAWDQVAESVGAALRDPDVREQIKSAASSFATALGVTMSELGTELRDSRDRAGEEE